jgi:hypothetical protein
MFADDSGIFEHQTLLDFIENRTAEDGSDLGPRLMQVFQALDTPRENRQSSLDEAIASLPYVNGGLFTEAIRTPISIRVCAAILLPPCDSIWSKVSPAIFWFNVPRRYDRKTPPQSRRSLHDERNILRVIKPLFLDDLYQESRRRRFMRATQKIRRTTQTTRQNR